jgi:hypothetical protein
MQDDAGNVWDMSSGKPVFVHGAQSAGGPQTIIPAPPGKPEFVPGHPNLVMTPSGDVKPLPGVPDPAPPAPNFIPNKPGYVVTGPPDKPTAVPIAGLPAGANVDLNAAQRAQALQQYSFGQQLQTVIKDLQQKYAKGPGATHGLQGAKDYLPFTVNKEFDAAADAARGIIGQALGFTGSQLNTEHESEMNIGPYLPHSGDRDDVIKDKMARLQNLADSAQQNAVRTLGGVPDAQGVVHPVSSSQTHTQPLPGAGQANDRTAFATGKTRDVIDPALKATGQRVGAMISRGDPDAQIIDFLKKSGVDPANTDIQDVLQFRKSPAFDQWQRQNPGQAYPIGPQFYTKPVPMTGLRQTVNRAAASDLGGTAIAAGAGMTNAIMGDRLGSAVGALTGEPGTAQTAMQMLATQHPAADLAGNIAGQAAFEGIAGGVPGVAKILASPMGRRAADALYGAYYGSGDNSGGDPGMGAVEGAGVNMLGGMFGRQSQKVLGRTLSGVKNAHLQYLDNLGIPLTMGQIGHGSDNVFGKIVGGLEDRAAGLPGTDAIINNARHRGVTGFNQAAFKEAGGSGATGAAGLYEVGQLRNNAYSFLNGVNLPLDAQFAGRNAAVRASIPAMPKFGDEIGKSLDLIDNVSSGGILPGQDWQSSISDLRGNKSSIAGQPFYRQAHKGMGEVESNLLDLADRQGPPGTLDNLNSANRLNAQVETLASALDNGPTQKADQLFSPGRLDDVSRVNARNFGGRMASLTGGNRPFYNLTQAGNAVLPKVVPDSGTAGRMMLVPLATSGIGSSIGAATGSDNRVEGGEEGLKWGALAGLLAAGPYSKMGQRVIQKALLGDRPDRIVQIGDYLINNSRPAGMFGGGLGRQYFFQPGLPQ